MASSTDDKEQWLAVRSLLKAALLADEIPVNTKVMKPKAVYEKFKDRLDELDAAFHLSNNCFRG